MARTSKLEGRARRHFRLRKRIEGTSERPRLVVFRSAKHIYAQVIDDGVRRTLVAASDVAKKGAVVATIAAEGEKDGEKEPDKKDRAKQVGMALAKKCLEKGIQKVVFDRGGYRYHGRISAVADGAREGGLEF